MNLIIRDEVAKMSEETEEVQPKTIEQLLKERRRCPCGRMFTPYRPYQKFCCDAHRVKYSKGKPSYYTKKVPYEHTCKTCGKKFMSNDDKKHYCDSVCYEEHEIKRRKVPELRVCMVCGKEFKSSHWLKRYCSSECRMKVRTL